MYRVSDLKKSHRSRLLASRLTSIFPQFLTRYSLAHFFLVWTDLVRQIQLSNSVDFIHAECYGSSTESSGAPCISLDLKKLHVSDKHVTLAFRHSKNCSNGSIEEWACNIRSSASCQSYGSLHPSRPRKSSWLNLVFTRPNLIVLFSAGEASSTRYLESSQTRLARLFSLTSCPLLILVSAQPLSSTSTSTRFLPSSSSASPLLFQPRWGLTRVKMQKRLQISLFKLILRLPLEHSPKPTNPFPLQSRALIPTYFVPNSIDSPNLKFFHAPVSNIHTFTYPFRPNPRTRSLTDQNRRGHSTESGGESVPLLDVNREVDMINLKFAEAREEIDMASESKETVYFDEEAECARAAVKETMDMFEGLLGKLQESEKAALQRSMGLKMEQLKAELQQLDD
ncbi:hypothetical protein DKX38_002247 [Salix brachista]|uniref:Uncharacterized protein n=1 Tax=Salix brachista TaxID=2182728 RepID=A0A5N5NLP8_9ROSI|nr:hypothetical protein DKX38_002247 [Salix brachista]